ncbi:hypothetical protein RRG08_053557 [Elysia crispata]|uniref:Uncharacterized protein n=1 Tax=Elysia crispata TaxID=231223 RepID=A0AAE0Y1N8_9GAST|nr:hypothetical protein RRG08_053557 [Elysia crispata]
MLLWLYTESCGDPPDLSTNISVLETSIPFHLKTSAHPGLELFPSEAQCSVLTFAKCLPVLGGDCGPPGGVSQTQAYLTTCRQLVLAAKTATGTRWRASDPGKIGCGDMSPQASLKVLQGECGEVQVEHWSKHSQDRWEEGGGDGGRGSTDAGVIFDPLIRSYLKMTFK